jgi:hypothetical protein
MLNLGEYMPGKQQKTVSQKAKEAVRKAKRKEKSTKTPKRKSGKCSTCGR